jgi:uncharacterized membrane protein (UPF0127 family)
MRSPSIGIVVLGLALLLPITSAIAMGKKLDGDVLWIETSSGTHEFSVEIADTPNLQRRGLMYRQSMPDDHGMIFPFPKARTASFTMRNTYISLDMIFVREDGTIESIIENTPALQDRSFPSQGVVKAVVEFNAGTAKKFDIKPGDLVRHTSLGTVE